MKQDATGFHLDTSAYPFHLREPFQEAVRRQSLIGWHSLLRGFVSKAWYDIAEATYDNPDRRNTLDGAFRIRSLSSSLYHYTEEIWMATNAQLHDQQDDTMAVIRSTSAAAIRDFHSKPESLFFGDQHLCEQPLEKFLTPIHRLKDDGSDAYENLENCTPSRVRVRHTSLVFSRVVRPPTAMQHCNVACTN
jgi:hypothetical protein